MAQLRIPLDPQRFAKGLSWKDYLEQMGDTRERTERNYQQAVLTDEDRQFFGKQTRVRYALMLAENWCGDVHRNSPALARITEAMPNCELRVLFRDQHLDLTDTLLNNGFRSIPVMVLFDESWNEIGRWIERPHAATVRVLATRAKTVDVAPADQKEAAMGELRKQIQAAYDGPTGLWREVVNEVRTLLSPPSERK